MPQITSQPLSLTRSRTQVCRIVAVVIDQEFLQIDDLLDDGAVRELIAELVGPRYQFMLSFVCLLLTIRHVGIEQVIPVITSCAAAFGVKLDAHCNYTPETVARIMCE